jgi:hypothetical protein
MERSAIPAPKQCGSYRPGHEVHWIQAIRSAEDSTPSRSGEVLGIAGEVIEVRFADGDVARYRHHDTARLRAELEALGPGVTVKARWSLLHCDSLHSIALDTGQPLSPCPSQEPVGTDPDALLARLHSYGGF